MRKTILFGTVAVLGLVAVEAISIQRQLSVEYQDVALAISQVQNVLNRQAELIPNLAETAKAYAKFEKDTFIGVASGRTVGTAAVDPNTVVNSADLQKQLAQNAQAATAMAGQALLQFKAVQEKYPELKGNSNFQVLMAELAGSANRISVERRKSQKSIQEFNKQLVQFPTNVFARLVGYKELPFYEASVSDQHAPKLQLSN